MTSGDECWKRARHEQERLDRMYSAMGDVQRSEAERIATAVKIVVEYLEEVGQFEEDDEGAGYPDKHVARALGVLRDYVKAHPNLVCE